MKSMPKEEVYVDVEDGSRNGPYEATVAGGTVVIWDRLADLDGAQNIVQLLPNGKERHLNINQHEFYRGMGSDLPDHYQVKVGKPTNPVSPSSSVTNNYNIGGSSNVQIGDGNKQDVAYFIGQMRDRIEASDATDEEKKEACVLLDKFAAHPIISSIIGSAAWNAIVQASS